jgi:hypothetical protein
VKEMKERKRIEEEKIRQKEENDERNEKGKTRNGIF